MTKTFHELHHFNSMKLLGQKSTDGPSICLIIIIIIIIIMLREPDPSIIPSQRNSPSTTTTTTATTITRTTAAATTFTYFRQSVIACLANCQSNQNLIETPVLYPDHKFTCPKVCKRFLPGIGAPGAPPPVTPGTGAPGEGEGEGDGAGAGIAIRAWSWIASIACSKRISSTSSSLVSWPPPLLPLDQMPGLGESLEARHQALLLGPQLHILVA